MRGAGPSGLRGARAAARMKEPANNSGPSSLQPEWWRVTLASIGDAVITTDAEGRVTFLNPVAESLTGWTTAASLGQAIDRVFRIVNEQTRRPVENPTVRALREGLVNGLANHTLLIARDGTERPIDDSAAPIRNSKGEVAGVVLVFRDIAERRRAEQEMQDALAYANNIIATLREPFLVLDKSLRIQTANAAFFETFLVSKEETEGRLLFDVGNRQWDIPRLRELLEEVLIQNHSFSGFDVEHDFPTIGRKSMLLNARRFASVDSRPELILLAIEDVTDRRLARASLRDSEARYRRLFETAKDGILILDADSGKILDSNPFMTELLGYLKTEFLDKELWEIGLFRDKSENEAAFRHLQSEGFVRYEHLPLQTRGGRTAEVEFVSNVYHVDHQHVAQCNIRDIGERTRLEEQTRAQAAELLDLHRRKDEFLAMLSHELRNPLAPILNAVQLLRHQQHEENPTQRQARTIIERQLGLLKRLVDDLLEVSRIMTGRVQLRLERVSMNGIAAAAVESVSPLIGRRGHQLSIALPPEPIWLLADAARLEQIVVNLLSNAAKYTDEGGRIWFSVRQEDGECVVSVRDTGVGIAPEVLPRIFDPFMQAERSMDRSQGGLGVGLTLAQRLTELHGGRIEAQSTLGKGSEFVVRLPAAAPHVSNAPSADEEPKPAGTPLRVLVVDDSVDTAASFAMLLRDSGHDVWTAHDGPAAIQAALAHRPEVVFLDIGLPGLNGYEVANRMRQQAGLQNAVLVAVTGYGQESDRQTSREAGFRHHLVKPTGFAEVQKILEEVGADPKRENDDAARSREQVPGPSGLVLGRGPTEDQ